MLRNEAQNEEKDMDEVEQLVSESASEENSNKHQGEENKEEDKEVDKEEGEEDRIKQYEKEIAELRDRLLRVHADFDNYRKRVNKEKEEWFKYASQDLIEKLLPVLDNFERAILAIDEQNEEVKNVLSGIKMIEKQLIEILEKEGLEPIVAVGSDFDPFLHEAVMQVPAPEGVADNQVVEEIRKGYLFKGRLLRASMVKVAKSE